MINQIVEQLTNVIWSMYFMIPIMIITAFYFAYKYQYNFIKVIGLSIKNMFVSSTDKEKRYTILGSFFISLGARVGTGNMAGVAIAINTGGPGAIFWMWVMAFIGTIHSFSETTLSQLYKQKINGRSYGGPSFYIQNGLKNAKLKNIYLVFLVLFAISVMSLQSNTAASAVTNLFIGSGANTHAFLLEGTIGLFIFILAIIILFAHGNRIFKVMTYIVGISIVFYFAIGIFVMVTNISLLSSTFHLIISSAFNPQSFLGGSVGSAVVIGFRRGILSNEAGMGTVSNVSGAADVDHPISAAFNQVLGVLVDTVLICSLTAFIILLSGVDYTSYTSIELFQISLYSEIGKSITVVLSVTLIAFALTTIVGASYYMQNALVHTPKFCKRILIIGLVIALISSVVKSELLWNLTDVFTAVLALINVYTIYKLKDDIINCKKDYFERNNRIFTNGKYLEWQ